MIKKHSTKNTQATYSSYARMFLWRAVFLLSGINEIDLLTIKSSQLLISILELNLELTNIISFFKYYKHDLPCLPNNRRRRRLEDSNMKNLNRKLPKC
jgi:hypothetical protein